MCSLVMIDSELRLRRIRDGDVKKNQQVNGVCVVFLLLLHVLYLNVTGFYLHCYFFCQHG